MEPEKKRVKLEEASLKLELAEYFATAEQKPPAESLLKFLESPLTSNANSPCLQGTVDTENNTALIAAVKAGADRAFYILLEGKDQGYINFQNSKGITALNIASHRGYIDYVKALLDKAKADVNIPNTSGSTSLIQASHFGHTEVVELLLTHGAIVDRPNHKGTTALMRAAQEGHVGVVKALLHSGADVNKRNHERMNALMLASQRGHDAIVKLLIKHGADIDCQTVQGSTALMLACKRQHEAVVEVLITAGAEMFVQDSRGRTARDTAQKRNNKNILGMLQASRQVRLMQMEARTLRNHEMARLYELHSKKRAFPVADINPWPVDNSTQMLHRIFELPFSLFQCIVRYIPWPRMWESVLPVLHKRCNIDPNEAIRGALTIMDEIFTDLLVSSQPVQEMHLIRAAHEVGITDLLRTKYKMPHDILETVVRWNDVQSVLSRFERQVSFQHQVADRAVKDAARLYSWYKFGGEERDGSGSSQAAAGLAGASSASDSGARLGEGGGVGVPAPQQAQQHHYLQLQHGQQQGQQQGQDVDGEGEGEGEADMEDSDPEEADGHGHHGHGHHVHGHGHGHGGAAGLLLPPPPPPPPLAHYPPLLPVAVAVGVAGVGGGHGPAPAAQPWQQHFGGHGLGLGLGNANVHGDYEGSSDEEV